MIHGGCVWETGNPADWLDFSANIRPEGPPEWVVEALRSSIDDVRYYPDINMRRARSGLSEYTGLPEECVLPTAGGEAAIDLALSYRNGRVYTLETDFGEYTRRAAVHGREQAKWPGKCGPGDTLILSNPGNPTGRVTSREELLALHEQLYRAGAELAVDEAFADYSPGCSLRREIRPGLIVIGSMTKILGIPGVRLGFLCAEPGMIRTLQERRRGQRRTPGGAKKAAGAPGRGGRAVRKQFPAGGLSQGYGRIRGNPERTGNPCAHMRVFRIAGKLHPPGRSD